VELERFGNLKLLFACLTLRHCNVENALGNVESDSTVDNVVDPSDHSDFRVHLQDNEQEPILAGSRDAVTVGLWSGADARQPAAPDAAYVAGASSHLEFLPLSSLARPWELWPAATAPNCQQWILAGS